MHDDLPVGLLELAARVDEGKPIDWDAEERAAADDDARAVIQGFRVLASVAAVAQDDSFDAVAAPSTWPRADHNLSGTAWGPLRLEKAVGRGAFSQVYRAVDPLGRHVAVKLLAQRLGGDDLSARVLDEGRVLASVKHPNIVVVHGADEHDGRVGLWMEFVHGRTLAAEVDARGALSADEAIVDRPGAVRRARRRPRQRAGPRRRQGAQRDARGRRPRRPHGLRRRPIDAAVGLGPGHAGRHAAVSLPRTPARRAADRGHRHLQPRRAALSPGHPGLSGRRRDTRRSR